MVSEDQKRAFVQSHCPNVTFHPHEQYFPCSIEHLLRGSTLKKCSGGGQDSLETVKSNPAADDLADLPGNHSEYYIEIAPTQLQGGITADRAISAPIYVSLVEVADLYVDIYYIALYAFQGSASFRCCPKIGHNRNVIAHEFGRHQGDIEHCIVRTDLAFSHVLSVGYEAHDKIAWFFPGMLFDNCMTMQYIPPLMHHSSLANDDSAFQGSILKTMVTLWCMPLCSIMAAISLMRQLQFQKVAPGMLRANSSGLKQVRYTLEQLLLCSADHAVQSNLKGCTHGAFSVYAVNAFMHPML